MVVLPDGILLVSGPSCSGKSTYLKASGASNSVTDRRALSAYEQAPGRGLETIRAVHWPLDIPIGPFERSWQEISRATAVTLVLLVPSLTSLAKRVSERLEQEPVRKPGSTYLRDRTSRYALPNFLFIRYLDFLDQAKQVDVQSIRLVTESGDEEVASIDGARRACAERYQDRGMRRGTIRSTATRIVTLVTREARATIA